MSKLLEQIEKLKKEKINQEIGELKEKLSTEAEELETNLSQLQSTYDEREKNLDHRLSEQVNFNTKKKLTFEVEKAKLEKLKKVWEEVTDKFLSDNKNFKKWLEYSVKSLPSKEGVLYANESYASVKEVAKGYKVEKKEIYDKGFIYESDDLYIDCTYSTYLNELYNKNKNKLYKLLFRNLE